MSWHAFVVGKILEGDHVEERKENHRGERPEYGMGNAREGSRISFRRGGNIVSVQVKSQSESPSGGFRAQAPSPAPSTTRLEPIVLVAVGGGRHLAGRERIFIPSPAGRRLPRRWRRCREKACLGSSARNGHGSDSDGCRGRGPPGPRAPCSLVRGSTSGGKRGAARQGRAEAG
jgi:hypothetical protein